MSNVVDNRVVEMRFDNSQFEANVNTSISTLEKLKQSLKLPGASKSLDNVNAAAKNFSMSGVSDAVNTASRSFSAMEIVAATALANITNKAVNAGERIVAALTIDPVRTGFNEYELKMDSVRTILNSTGEPLEHINELLNELNTYSDETIYSFQDMTRNIGKFTNSGVKLENAVKAIKGISNEAAVSGANANEASRAMYNFAQALSSGAVKLIDWKSIENANMATVEFKNQLLDTALAMGTVTKTSDGMYQSGKKTFTATKDFNDSLQTQWMTTDVLIQTLENYATDIRKMSDAEVKEYEAKLKSIGYTEEQIKSIEELGKKAFDSAQDVTKFTQMWDILKETAQSGWAQTWEMILGDFEEAKALFTPLTNFFSNIVQSIDNFRNGVLKEALININFDSWVESVSGILNPIQGTVKSMGEIVQELKNYEEIVTQIIAGDFGNGQERFDALSKAGYDWAHAQNLVNEKLGNSFRYETEYSESVEKTSKNLKVASKETTELNHAQIQQLRNLMLLSEEELRNANYTDDQIKALNRVKELAEETGLSYTEILRNINSINGRWLLIDAFKNVGNTLVDVFGAIKQGFLDIFWPGYTAAEIIQEVGERVWKSIEHFHKLTEAMLLNKGTAEKITRAFRGVFAVMDLVKDVVSGVFSAAFRLASGVVSNFNFDILELVARVGDAIVTFHDWVESGDLINKSIDAIVPSIIKMVSAISDWVKSLGEIEAVRKVMDAFGNSYSRVKDVVSALIELDNLTFDNVINSLGQIKDILGEEFSQIFNPEFFKSLIDSIPDDFLQNLINKFAESTKGVRESVDNIINTVKTAISEKMSKLDFGPIIAGAFGGTTVFAFKKIGDVLSKLFDPVFNFSKSINGVIDGVGKSLLALGKYLNAMSFNLRSDGIMKIALAIAALSASVYLLSKVGDVGALWHAVGAVWALSAAVAALAVFVSLISKSAVTIGKGGIKINTMKNSMVGIGLAILALVAAIKILGSADAEELAQGEKEVVKIAAGLLVLSAALAGISRIGSISGMGTSILAIVGAIYLLVEVCKAVNKLKPEAMAKGAAFVLVFSAFIVALSLIKRFIGPVGKSLGVNMLALVASIYVLVEVCKAANRLSPEAMAKGAAFAGAFAVFVAALSAINKFLGPVASIGKSMAAISGAMLLMVGVVMLCGLLSLPAIGKAVLFIGIFTAFVLGLSAINKFAGEVGKIGLTMMAISVAVGILAGVAIILGVMPIGALAKGLVAVGVLMSFVAGVVYVTKFAGTLKTGPLIVLTVAIGILTAAVIALSFLDPFSLIAPTLALGALMVLFGIMIKTASTAQAAMGPLIVMTVAIGILSAGLFLLAMLPANQTLVAAIALSGAMMAVAGAFKIISTVGASAMAAMPGLAIMGVVVVAIAGVLGLLEHFDCAPSIETAGAISILLGAMAGVYVALGATGGLAGAALTGALGMMGVIAIIGVVAAAIGGIMSLIPEGIVESWKSGLQSFLDFIVILAEGLGKAIGSFVGGALEGISTGLESLGTSLGNFGNSIGPFVDQVKSIDASAMEGVENLANFVLKLSGANLLDSIAKIIGKKDSMEKFVEQIKTFGSAISEFSSSVNVDSSAVQAAADAGELISSLVNALPEDKLFDGKMSMDAFSKKITKFGEKLNEFSEEISGMGSTDISGALDNAKEIVDFVKDAAGIDTGNLDKFKPGAIGESIKEYADNVKGLTDSDISSSIESANKLIELASTVSGADVSGIDNFKRIKEVASTLKEYSKTAAGINSGAIDSSISLTDKLMNMMGSLGSVDISGAESFTSSLSSFGQSQMENLLKGFDGSGSQFTSVGTNLIQSLTKGLRSGSSGITTSATSVVNSALRAITGKSGMFATAGSSLTRALATGIIGGSSYVSSAAGSAASSGAAGARNYHSSFVNAGSYLASGLAAGIRNNLATVRAAAAELAAAATVETKSSLKINSPSKVFMAIGSGVVEGFVKGIRENESDAARAAVHMSGTAKSAFTRAVQGIFSVINEDIEVQPTISPVLDLSEIKSEAKNIGGLFGTASISTNVGAVSTMMARNQNGSTTDDVVEAIDRMRKSMGDVGTTNIINGVTYDDGSAAAMAVETLIRAIRMERRM